jgi:hypothetical protein
MRYWQSTWPGDRVRPSCVATGQLTTAQTSHNSYAQNRTFTTRSVTLNANTKKPKRVETCYISRGNGTVVIYYILRYNQRLVEHITNSLLELDLAIKQYYAAPTLVNTPRII